MSWKFNIWSCPIPQVMLASVATATVLFSKRRSKVEKIEPPTPWVSLSWAAQGENDDFILFDFHCLLPLLIYSITNLGHHAL